MHPNNHSLYWLGALLLLAAAIAHRFPTAQATPTTPGLELRTKPPGATVMRDGVEVGTTPLHVTDFRQSTLQLRMFGYKTETVRVTASQRGEVHTYELMPQPRKR